MSEQITTAEELDALPMGSVVVEGDHTTPDASGLGFEVMPGVFHRFPSGWYVVAGHGPRDVPLPATLLYRPDAPVTAGATVTREQVERTLAQIEAQVEVGEDETLGKWAYRSRLMYLYRDLLPEIRTALGLTVVDGPSEGVDRG